jgi:hypothetical protein
MGERSKTELPSNRDDTDAPVFQVGPLSSFTQESLDVIKAAASQIDYSRDLRNKSTALIKDCLEYSKKNTKVVDEVFQKKIQETLALSVRKICLKLNGFFRGYFIDDFNGTFLEKFGCQYWAE